jgi:hypothetical protein
MGGRRADNGQADRDIDRVLEVEQLDGDHSLVVVHGDHRIEFAPHGPGKDGIGRDRADAVDTLLLGQQDRRGDDPLLLIAELAVLAGGWLTAAPSRGCRWRRIPSRHR